MPTLFHAHNIFCLGGVYGITKSSSIYLKTDKVYWLAGLSKKPNPNVLYQLKSDIVHNYPLFCTMAKRSLPTLNIALQHLSKEA